MQLLWPKIQLHRPNSPTKQNKTKRKNKISFAPNSRGESKPIFHRFENFETSLICGKEFSTNFIDNKTQYIYGPRGE